ncbi:MAG: hypothetical protein J7M38_05385, partial [Armatimonadetes bacterium]|nr:hypothetical protein [Armatimonadota bacterium]
TTTTAAWKTVPGPHQVVTIADAVLHDDARDKDLPLTIRLPAEAGQYPVIIFSHGAGGSGEGYEYLSSFWASHGYVCIHPTHADSLELRGLAWNRENAVAMVHDALTNVEGWRNRVADIKLVLDSLSRLEETFAALAGKMDHSRIGMGGHSFGAWTTQAIGGVVLHFPDTDEAVCFADDRIAATLMLSPQGPDQMGLIENSWDGYELPMMVMTGSEDYGARGQDPSWRMSPFDHSSAGDKYLVWIEGANHFSFSGNLLAVLAGRSSAVQERAIREWVQQASLAFWDAYLKNDAAAMAWLASDKLPELSGGVVELRRR